MSFLTGYLLLAYLERADDPQLPRLYRKLPDDDSRDLVRLLAATAPDERRETLDAWIASRNGSAAEIIGAIEWARSAGLEGCREAIAKVHPLHGEIDLETAAEGFAETTWLWHPWVPFGYLTILAGMAGIGKSNVALAYAAAVLGTRPWPDGTRTGPEERGDRSNVVVWLDTEGSQAMLAERARNQGLPLAQFKWPLDPQQPGNTTPTWRLDDTRQMTILAQYLDELRPALVVIDSLSGAHGGDENSSDMRLILQRLAELARDLDIAILLTHHLRKSGEGEHANVLRGIERMRGSSTIAQFARVVLGLDAPNNESPTALRMRPLKNNLAALAEPVGASIEAGTVHFSNQAPEEPVRHTVAGEAADFLEGILRNGPMPVATIKSEAEGRAISWNAVERAGKILNVTKRRQNTTGAHGGGHWEWALLARIIPGEAQE